VLLHRVGYYFLDAGVIRADQAINEMVEGFGAGEMLNRSGLLNVGNFDGFIDGSAYLVQGVTALRQEHNCSNGKNDAELGYFHIDLRYWD